MSHICAVMIRIILASRASKSAKLADAEVHFSNGPMEGLRLCGFSVWGHRNGVDKKKATNVVFPARHYTTSKNEKREYLFIRLQDGAAADRVDEITQLILDAYETERHL